MEADEEAEGGQREEAEGDQRRLKVANDEEAEGCQRRLNLIGILGQWRPESQGRGYTSRME